MVTLNTVKLITRLIQRLDFGTQHPNERLIQNIVWEGVGFIATFQQMLLEGNVFSHVC